MAPESNRSIAVGLSLAAGILMINLWMRNQSDTDSETAAACGNNTKDEVSGSFSKKTASDSSLGNDDTKSEEVDLHGRPWRAKGVGKHARAQHWTSRPSTANAWGVDEANAMANEQPLVVPRDSRTGALLPITAATLPQWLTVVMTTSPVTSNPSTALIEEVVASMQLVKHLDKCPKLVICDGYKVRDKNKFRSGEITADRVAAYSNYKENLKALALADGGTPAVTTTAAATYTAVIPESGTPASPQRPSSLSRRDSTSGSSGDSNDVSGVLEDERTAGAKGLAGCALLELEERSGFGFAMREGINWVTTPFVIVVQHDRAFNHASFQRFESSSKHYKPHQQNAAANLNVPVSETDQAYTEVEEPVTMPDDSLVDLVATVKAMRAHRSWMHYVGLATSRTIKHAQLVLSKYQMRVQSVTASIYGHQAASSMESTDEVHSKALLALEAKGCPEWDASSNGGEGECKIDVHASESGPDSTERTDEENDENDDEPSHVRLVPLVQWYDTTHIASTWYYRRFVFDRRARRVAKGGFIEDKLGQEQLRLFLERGIEAHVPYGTFILDHAFEAYQIAESRALRMTKASAQLADNKRAPAAEVAAAEDAAIKARAAAVDAAVAAGDGAKSSFASTMQSTGSGAGRVGYADGAGTGVSAENGALKTVVRVVNAPPWGVIGGEPLVAHLDGHDPRNSGKFVHAGAAHTTAAGTAASEPGSSGSNSNLRTLSSNKQTDEMATILARAPHRETKHSGHRQQKQSAAPAVLDSESGN